MVEVGLDPMGQDPAESGLDPVGQDLLVLVVVGVELGDPVVMDPGVDPVELDPGKDELLCWRCWEIVCLLVESWVEVVWMGKLRLGRMRIGSRFPHGSVRRVPHFCFGCCWNICAIRTGVFRNYFYRLPGSESSWIPDGCWSWVCGGEWVIWGVG